MSKASRVGDDVTLLDYAELIWRYKWIILGFWAVVILGTYVGTVTSPKIYEATTTIMSPRETAGAGFLSGLAGGLAQQVPGLAQQVPGVVLSSLTPNRDMLLSLLKSRTMEEAVVRRFGLKERYRARYLDQAIKRLEAATNLAVTKEGVISLRFEDTDPDLVAQVANFYVDSLERLVAQFSTTDAGRKRRFISEQLVRAKSELENDEDMLRRSQERNRAVVLQEQTRGAIEAAARLKGEIIATDVQLQVMRSFATEANPEVVALRRRRDEMRRQLSQMEYGDELTERASRARTGDQREFSVPFAKVPEIGLDLARLTRNVKIQEVVVTLLTQQLEQAKIDEAKDLPVVQVLDHAVVPEHHSKPRLRSNLMLAGVVALFASLILVFFIEYVRRLREQRAAA